MVNTNEKNIFAFPCGIGDDVYFIPSKVNYDLNILNGMSENNRVYHQKIASITTNSSGWYVELDKDIEFGTGRVCVDVLFEKTWFLSRQEAEQTLEKMESEANNGKQEI
jgi:hypothetical protein